ncbi:hypothetical protein I7I48_05373 [Histoplasma ohiense]|nr:hypothetical protein I7I48_05373 [Histoplasma ohiense (nom. inval.)]
MQMKNQQAKPALFSFIIDYIYINIYINYLQGPSYLSNTEISTFILCSYQWRGYSKGFDEGFEGRWIRIDGVCTSQLCRGIFLLLGRHVWLGGTQGGLGTGALEHENRSEFSQTENQE